jgi:hypothetical protein
MLFILRQQFELIQSQPKKQTRLKGNKKKKKRKNETKKFTTIHQ